jgi:hypothetical protein
MNSVVVLEWRFSPPDYFESQIEIKQHDYNMVIADGKAEAKIDSVVYEANPSIRDELDDVLRSQFLGLQLSSRETFDISRPNMVRVEHSDGLPDYILEAEPGRIELRGHQVRLLGIDKDGNVVADQQTEAAKRIAELVSKHYEDEVLKSLLKSWDASVNDPENELVHLYEIRDALSRRFGNGDKARYSLGISNTKWSRFGTLCNREPLKQSRHRGEHDTLRDATENELCEVRGIAKDWIESYLQYLETTTL